MSMFRCVLLLALISLLACGILFFLGSSSDFEEFRGGYAVLETDSQTDDKLLADLLNSSAGSFGGSPISESAQWVMLDNFGFLEMVPLDKYSSRILSFDPRNDGYAGKLKNVFVRGDKRFIYIPLKAGKWNSSSLDRQFESLLKDIPYSVSYFGSEKPVYLYLLSFALSCACVLLICYVNRKRHQGNAAIVVLIPALSSFAFYGASGIAFASLLLALFSLFREPVKELVSHPKSIYNEILLPNKFCFFTLPFFAASFAVIVIFSQLKISFVLAAFALCLAVFFLSFILLSNVNEKRRRFSPIMIIKRRSPDLSFSYYMLPFAAAAFLTVYLAPMYSGGYVSGEEFTQIIEEDDYYEHLTFQAAFSVRQLGSPWMTSSADSYPGFTAAGDGLPYPAERSENFTLNKNDFPPFPLANLMEFFKNVNSGEKPDNGSFTKNQIMEELSLLVLLLFIVPVFFIKRKDFPQKSGFSSLKKSDGKSLFPRNKAYVLGGRGQLGKSAQGRQAL
jgi:hypothetical protein